MSKRMEEKKLRLFGFEVDPHASPSDHETASSSSTNLIIHEDKFMTDEKLQQLSKARMVEKQVQCQFCCKKFANSQALGGHQNAHKKERVKKKKLQMQAKRESFNCYLQSLHSQSHTFEYLSSSATSWFFDQSNCVSDQFRLYAEEPPASFKLAFDTGSSALVPSKEKLGMLRRETRLEFNSSSSAKRSKALDLAL